MNDPKKKLKAPSREEIDAMGIFHSSAIECEALCLDLADTVDELQDATEKRRVILLSRINAISARLKALHCKPCTTIE